MSVTPRAIAQRIALAIPFVFGACAPSVSHVTGPTPAMESRIYDTHAQRYVDFAALAQHAASADVVFFGEQHDDPATHRAELALLAAIGAQRPNVVVSVEMLERDVQPTLDKYLAGIITDSVFNATSRPWPNYTTDYRPLVELARAHRWPVLAANVPRRLAAVVSHAGLAALDTVPASDRALVAREIKCPHDKYYDRFAEEMGGHSAGGGPGSVSDTSAARAMTDRFYEAQCIKDETMAESIANARTKDGSAIVVHYNGAFHTDMGLGTAARFMRRMPNAKTVLITAVPVDDVMHPDVASFAGLADYVVITPAPPKAVH